MTESSLQTELLHFLRKYAPKVDFICELKLVKKGNFQMSKIEPHQIETISSVNKPFAYKIIDPSVNIEGSVKTSRRPLDFVYFGNPRRYYGIGFWVSRKKKIVYFVTHNELVQSKNKYKRLTEEVVRSASEFGIDLKLNKFISYRNEGV